MAEIAFRTDQRDGVPSTRGHPLRGSAHEGSERREPPVPLDLRIEGREVREGNDRSDGLAPALDDDPLARGGLVDHLTEPGPNLQGTDGSHGEIIALSEFAIDWGAARGPQLEQCGAREPLRRIGWAREARDMAKAAKGAS